MHEFLKSARLGIGQVDEEELKKINEYTLTPLKAEDVFAFKVMAGDNMEDDRNYEPFTTKAIKDMAKLYPGRPMIWEHGRGSKGTEQVARVYEAQAVETGKSLASGTPEVQLILKAYMLNNESNADLIAEIKAGIKKEVSTSALPEKLVCSICGADNMQTYCRHWAGRSYDGKTCMMAIDGVKDVLEISFVGKPAQPRAGVSKSKNYSPFLTDKAPEDFKEVDKKEAHFEEEETYLKEIELFLMAEEAQEERK